MNVKDALNERYAGRRGILDSIGTSERALKRLAESTFRGERPTEAESSRWRGRSRHKQVSGNKEKGSRLLDQSENGEWIHYYRP